MVTFARSILLAVGLSLVAPSINGAVVYVALIDQTGTAFGSHRWAVNFDENLYTPDGFDVLKAIFSSSHAVSGSVHTLSDVSGNSVSINDYGTTTDPNMFLNGIRMNGVTLTNTGAPTYSPSWSQWIDQGVYGFPNQDLDEDSEWNFGSGMSDPYRQFVGSPTNVYYEAYVYGGSGEPSFAPSATYFNGATSVTLVPEPSRMLLVAVGVMCAIGRRKRRDEC